ncbi:enoyl-CoA hydratase/isomerase family protein [Nocardioides sp. LS1]|uniref:enoyl-CoA hydratase/isomerase family protein n=1 Tax=Nocardioides sp. LS1 TaxID=1027620 RepID=UPI000F627510|nr:enoyl-CoA hydratase-related protein [Nocardioides sp. LS1]GCD91114.1 enoyl-CoA hydratase [Nocardioides sp. LS1]
MSVLFEVDNGVATVTINRPERMNAMDGATYEALSHAWIRIRDDVEIRAAVVTGAGEKSFTAGADLKSFVGSAGDLSEFWNTQKDPLLNRGLEVHKPVVAAVNGYCFGGGVTLLLATDLRVASSHATFALSEVKRGLLPANGGTQRVLEQLPHPIAMEMLLLGEPVDAETAQRWGLINKVVPADKLMEEALSYARRLASLPPLAVQACKELAIRARDMDRPSGLRLEETMLRMLKFTDDAAEGIAAFAERRDPVWQGR